MNTFGILGIVVFAGLLSGCQAPLKTGTAGLADEHAALLAVLAHMVVRADDSAQSICFVELGASDLERLRRDCGQRYQIFPIETSQDYTIESPGPDVWGLHLKGTAKEGVHIQARVTRVDRDKAEATGSYQGRLWGSGWRYQLRYADGTWRVVAAECLVAS